VSCARWVMAALACTGPNHGMCACRASVCASWGHVLLPFMAAIAALLSAWGSGAWAEQGLLLLLLLLLPFLLLLLLLLLSFLLLLLLLPFLLLMLVEAGAAEPAAAPCTPPSHCWLPPLAVPFA